MSATNSETAIEAKPRPPRLKDFLLRPQVQDAIAANAPKHLTVDRLTRVALLAVDRDKSGKLALCTHSSIVGAILQSSQLGLEIGGVNGHAYLVPYKNRVRDSSGKWITQYEATFIPGYRGLIQLVWRAAKIDVEADAVYDADAFDWSRGTDGHLSHRPSMDADRGNPIAYWAMARLADGRKKFEVMSVSQVERIRDRKGGVPDQSPWVTDFDEMSKKTVAKRLIKWLPVVDDSLATAVDVDNQAASGTPIVYDDIVDAESREAAPKVSRGLDAVRDAGAMTDEEKAAALAEESEH